MTTVTTEEADRLVLEHQGWAESIARSVARAWNMDWRSDGLDGAALEALLFCARRYEPDRGVPFRGYARKRIHEASTEAARKTKGWKRGLGNETSGDTEAREISAQLLNIFPELRYGEIAVSDESNADPSHDFRSAIRNLIVGASIIAAKQESITNSSPDDVMDYKRLIEIMATLEPVHQAMMWKIYWEGESMRTVAEEWSIDELNVIREHKALLAFLSKTFNTARDLARPRVRPGLKQIAMKLRRNSYTGEFSQIVAHGIESRSDPE